MKGEKGSTTKENQNLIDIRHSAQSKRLKGGKGKRKTRKEKTQKIKRGSQITCPAPQGGVCPKNKKKEKQREKNKAATPETGRAASGG